MKQSPVDLVEEESELVSGFNIQYFGIKFALIITKYAMIILFCFIVLFIFRNLLYS